MAITIKGIRITSIQLTLDKETGFFRIENSQYELLSSTDHVLAQQAIGGYGGRTLKATQETEKLLSQFVQSYRKDVDTTLGLNEP